MAGPVEKAKGAIKEKLGEATDNPDLRREGSAQRDRGEAETEATKARAEAKAHEAKAKAHEVEQERAQESKEH